MKFIKALDLTNAETAAAIQTGAQKLQVGNWVRVGAERPGRIVRVSSEGIIQVVYPHLQNKSKQRDGAAFDKWLKVVRINRAIREKGTQIDMFDAVA